LPVTKRGEDYGAYKEALGAKMWQVVAELFPHLADKVGGASLVSTISPSLLCLFQVEFIEVGTPLSHKHYLNAPHGEIYGLDHNFARFSPLNTALLRPQTAVANLYLTGQDILSCGWSGAMFSGLLTASAILKRNLLHELVEAMKGFYANRAKPQQNGHANGTGTH
jgi:all-trans-retinol 13,14-reductase